MGRLRKPWSPTGEPAGEFWFELLAEIGAHIVSNLRRGRRRAISRPPPQAKSVLRACTSTGTVPSDWKSVEHDMGTDFVGLFDNGFGILNERTAEDYVGDWDQQGLLVDGVEEGSVGTVMPSSVFTM